MKTLSLLSSALLLSSFCFSQVPDSEIPTGNALMEFETTEHDFGKIGDTIEVEFTFKFKNTGTEPLTITQARGSCGCTVPEYPLEPIAVGESGEIRVSFNPANKIGVQTKTVSITANTTPAMTVLKITSDVVPKPVIINIKPSNTEAPNTEVTNTNKVSNNDTKKNKTPSKRKKKKGAEIKTNSKTGSK